MFKIKVNKKYDFTFHTDSLSGQTTVSDQPVEGDFVKIKDNLYHIILNNKSITAEVVEADFASKTFRIKVNNHIYTVEAADKYDELLQQMGFDLKNNLKADNIKAPMPGLVLDVNVTEGQEIKKGEAVVVLEAMKMENILKAASDGKVKRIAVKKGDKVEKNDVLVEMQ